MPTPTAATPSTPPTVIYWLSGCGRSSPAAIPCSTRRRPPQVVVVGLTGAIGSGKSSVAALLAERGAVVVDSDDLAREVVEPGQAAHAAVIERFGPGVVVGDGQIDRQTLADMAFADPAA
ncbi:MAG: dephospho-CoA kinase, partial [Candidatus Aeolococcus gillhamiae]